MHRLRVSGSGNITVAGMIAAYADLKISDSGDIKIQSGAITEQKLKISESGSIDLSNVSNRCAVKTLFVF